MLYSVYQGGNMINAILYKLETTRHRIYRDTTWIYLPVMFLFFYFGMVGITAWYYGFSLFQIGTAFLSTWFLSFILYRTTKMSALQHAVMTLSSFVYVLYLEGSQPEAVLKVLLCSFFLRFFIVPICSNLVEASLI